MVNVISLLPLLWVIKSTLYSIVDTVHMAWNMITADGYLTSKLLLIPLLVVVQVMVPYGVGTKVAADHIFMKVLIAEAFFFQFFKNHVDAYESDERVGSDDFTNLYVISLASSLVVMSHRIDSCFFNLEDFPWLSMVMICMAVLTMMYEVGYQFLVSYKLVDHWDYYTKVESTQVCVICCHDTDEHTMTTPCGHTYHDVCLQTWMRQKHQCPMCKQGLPKVY